MRTNFHNTASLTSFVVVIQVKPRKRKYESTYNENEPFEEDVSKDTVTGRVTKKQRMLSKSSIICNT
jgi:hypothetical protein